MKTVEGLATISLRDDGIVVYEYCEGAVVDLSVAKKVVAAATEFLDRPHPSIIQLREVVRVTRDARAFFADSDENRRVVSSAALVVGNALSRTIGNFFLGLNRTEFETRLFGSIEEAAAWLRRSDG